MLHYITIYINPVESGKLKVMNIIRHNEVSYNSLVFMLDWYICYT